MEKSLAEELTLLQEHAPEVIGFLKSLRPVLQGDVDANFKLSHDESGFVKLFIHPLHVPEDAQEPVWCGSAITLSPAFMAAIVDKE